MSAVKNWMEGKPINIALSAIAIANSASEVSDALTKIREQVDIEIDQPPLNQWLGFYTNHRAIINLLQKLFTFDGSKKLINEILCDEGEDFSAEEKKQFAQLFFQPATLFFLKVWSPCLVHYKTTPTRLFRQARLGKISAFEKLLRLDNSVIFDKRLSEQFHQHKANPNKKNYRRLLQAFSKPVTKKTDIEHIKRMSAGLISHLTESMGHRLTEPQIRGLFDAIAQAKNQGLQDEDISPSPDTFAQAIRRESKEIRSQHKQPDKK